MGAAAGVAQAQNVPPGTPRLANPASRVGVGAFRTALRVASNPLAKRLTGGLFTPPADAIDLPDYAHLG